MLNKIIKIVKRKNRSGVERFLMVGWLVLT